MLRNRITNIVSITIVVLVATLITLAHPTPVRADSTYTVTVTGDGGDDTPGDNTCADSNGDCTLRAAIQEANAHAGPDIIHFNITGAPDFGVDGYRIELINQLPDITETLTIDGSTQPGYIANTAANPQPFNGHIVVEIDASQLSSSTSLRFMSADNSILRGLSVGGSKWGVIFSNSENAMIEGSYLGIRADSSAFSGVDTANSALTISGGSNNSRVGGTLPSQRNVLGNTEYGLFISDFYENDTTVATSGVVVQGNFFGVEPDGTTAAAFSNNAMGIIGSSQNQIGGTSLAARNIIGNSRGGVTIDSSADNDANDNRVQGNYIGVLADGITPAGVSGEGISVSALNVGRKADRTIIGGTATGAGNIIANAGFLFISTKHANQTVIQGNYMGVDASGELNSGFISPILAMLVTSSESLIGGTTAGAGNIVAGGTYGGVVVSSTSIFTAQHNVILGNSIHDNGSAMGGIELNASTVAGFSPDINVGPTPNDVGDTDTGTNNYINTPVITSAQYDNSKLRLQYDLDAADSPSNTYRVEFFGNTTTGTGGYGEGQTYLGSAEVSPGNGNTALLTVPGGYDLSGKYITATTTAIDDTKISGFGSTSEFSLAVATVYQEGIGAESSDGDSSQGVIATANLASTGENIKRFAILAAVLLLAGGGVIVAVVTVRKRRYSL